MTDDRATPANIENISDSDLLRIIIHGTTAFEVLRTALEFDLFGHLESAEGLSADQVAKAIGVDGQPARILLLALASLRLVRKDEATGKYVNSDIARRKLLRSSPRFLGPLVDVQEKVINPGMGDFADAMRQNTNVGLRYLDGPGTTLYERLIKHPELQQVFYRNMSDASSKALPQAFDVIDFSRLTHIIDLAAGDGVNGIELALRHPHLKITAHDQGTAVQIAEQNAIKAGIRDRVTPSSGDLFKDPFPSGADGILYFHIFEIWSVARNIELLKKCYDALPPEGVVLVYSFVSNDENTGPLTAGLVSPYFLTLASGEGMMYSSLDMVTAVQSAGFTRIERYENVGFSHTLVAGYKERGPLSVS
jgi:methyltransferase